MSWFRKKLEFLSLEGPSTRFIDESRSDRFYKKLPIRFYSPLNLYSCHCNWTEAKLSSMFSISGRLLKVVNGAHRGETAVMVSLDEKTYSVAVRLETVSKKR